MLILTEVGVFSKMGEDHKPTPFPTHSLTVVLFIGPESDHWQCLSVTHSLTDSLTHSCLVNLIDVTLACEDAYSKLVEVVTVAD